MEYETNPAPFSGTHLTGNALLGKDDGRICKDHGENTEFEKHEAALWAFTMCYKAVKKD